MHKHPDNAILRRFGELNLLNLLRLQADLQDIENELLQIREEDLLSEDPVRICYSKDFRVMRDNERVGGDSEQYDLLIKIGNKLQEYNAALALALQVKGAEQPTERELENLRSWLRRPKGGNDFLAGEEAKVWEDKNASEYVTLFPRADLENDAFTSFLGGRLLDVYHSIWGGNRKAKYGTEPGEVEIRKYSGRKIAKTGNIAVAIISSILPTLVILALYFVKRMIVRIGLVILFTAIFSVALAVFTAACKVEIFSATAAFAAVEVVFIGSTTNSSTGAY
ncbi:hypothetical protein J1614_010799 [Plenodomus biglobosus]|nr:hypothetical protein J1614_010799 [Plenodomus biglobosus]